MGAEGGRGPTVGAEGGRGRGERGVPAECVVLGVGGWRGGGGEGGWCHICSLTKQAGVYSV